MKYKTGAAWMDEQIIMHVKNAFRGDLIDWFNSLTTLGIDKSYCFFNLTQSSLKNKNTAFCDFLTISV